jgi:hypothetical protein
LKPAADISAAAQSIATLAFNGTALTALNFTGTKVTELPVSLLMDGANVEYNESLETVTLTKDFTALNGSLAACVALTAVNNLDKATAITGLADDEFAGDLLLATINTKNIKTFGARAFAACASLTSVSLAAATTLGTYTFTATGLTSVSFPKTVPSIPEGCFYACEDLATVTFANDYLTFEGIGEYAFAYTAITEIEIPACLPANTVDNLVATKAFGGCENLEKFTYNPTTAVSNAVVNENAFLGCSDVVFVTTEAYMTQNKVAPKNTSYVEKEAVTMKFTPVEFKKTPGKYYVKWQNAGKKIKIKKTEAKVYDAYLDEGDKTLNMVQFKPYNGYYYIAQNQVALIITDKADLSYEDSEKAADYHTSWITPIGKQIMKIAAADEPRLDAEEDAYTAGCDYIYGWLNSATKGTGWGKISSGKTLPKGTLYLFANEEVAAAPGLKVVWRDENGNIEDSEVTGIEEIFSNAQENGEMFNLQGIRVNNAQKGIYIQNGKKFVVK